jgi:hypothetical protein
MRPISIWRPIVVDGELAFERPPVGPRGDHYADRRRIFANARRPRRVVLLGESAAAGYLLAPTITPAKVLQSLLGDDTDVVDLARTNERILSLAETAEAAMQLGPDAVILFTGNNWNLLETPWASCQYPDPDARGAFAEACRAGGLLGPAQRAARSLRRAATSLFERLAALGCRVTVVVPEVNLVDTSRDQPTPWLAGRDTLRWHGLARQARSGSSRALIHAQRLATLDDGRTPTAFDRLARVHLQADDRQRALLAFRAAVDSDRYATMATLAAPQASPSVQELLREQARHHHFDVVDLPALFAEDGQLPDRRLFYDYCHLTPEGIERAMRAVAELLGGVRGVPLEVPSSCAWRAAFGAAVHGVHRGATGPIVRHWLRQALQVPEAGEALDDLVATRFAAVDAELTEGQRRHPGLTAQHGWDWPDLDGELLAAADELRPASRSRWSRLPRIEPYSRLDRFYADAMVFDDTPRRAAIRAPWPRTDLLLIGGGPMEVELCLRTPGPGQVALSCDGRPLGRRPVDSDWTRWRVRLTPPLGLHRLTLRWPAPTIDGDLALDRALERLARGREAAIHPVFGELFSWRVVVA